MLMKIKIYQSIMSIRIKSTTETHTQPYISLAHLKIALLNAAYSIKISLYIKFESHQTAFYNLDDRDFQAKYLT